MSENKREMLNLLYRPLDDKMRELIVTLTKMHGGYKITSGFFNGHYHKNDAGLYQEDKYPIPVISIMGLCDIEIDFDGISVTTKLSKDQIVPFDWSSFGTVSFEVYGVENYLNDYGNNLNIHALKDNVLSSPEKEFFISFSFPISTSGKEVLSFFKFLQRNHFYY